MEAQQEGEQEGADNTTPTIDQQHQKENSEQKAKDDDDDDEEEEEKDKDTEKELDKAKQDAKEVVEKARIWGASISNAKKQWEEGRGK